MWRWFFFAVLFDKVEYGVDPDKSALKIAVSLNVYEDIINSFAEKTELPDCSVASIMSNSVLEHTMNVEAIIQEANRILELGGIFIFTVPNNEFTIIMANYFGYREAQRLNKKEFYHRNLLSNSEWSDLLKRNNFKIELLKNYQPPEFNYYFRLLRSPIIKKLNKYFKFWKEPFFLKLIKESLLNNKGGGSFIIAKKVTTQHDFIR